MLVQFLASVLVMVGLQSPPVNLFTVANMSSKFNMSDADFRADVLEALSKKPDALTATEVGEDGRQAVFVRIARRQGYQPIVSNVSDSAILLNKSTTDFVSKKETVDVPAVHKPPSQGGHGARSTITAVVTWRGNTVGVTTTHWVTGRKVSAVRNAQHHDQTASVIRQTRETSYGKDLGFFSGDINDPDDPRNDAYPDKDLVDAGLITVWDESNWYPDTNDGGPNVPIDLVGSSYRDGRVSLNSVRRFELFSDHDLIVAIYAVRV